MTASGEISISNLSLYRGRSLVIDTLNLRVGQGITAVLGPNGAGKSTLLDAVGGTRHPPPGKVFLDGFDLGSPQGRRAVRGSVGYLPQHFDLAGALTLRNTVMYAGWCNGLERIEMEGAADRALEQVGLAGLAHRRCRSLSGGERQRLGLAAAIAHSPETLILDEPTVGMDPDQRVRVRTCLAAIRSTTTIVISTHLLDDVSQVADRVIVLASGRVVWDGTPAELSALDDRAHVDRVGESSIEFGYRRVLEGDQ